MPFDISERLSAVAGGLPGARWTRDENFHLTLRFIGDVDEGVADDVDGALSARPRRQGSQIHLPPSFKSPTRISSGQVKPGDFETCFALCTIFRPNDKHDH